MPFAGGATVIIDPKGRVRYVITKSILSDQRIAEQSAFSRSASGQPFWSTADGGLRAHPNPFTAMHVGTPDVPDAAEEPAAASA
jgi:hypothetical protein